jgi:hypothetical protein
MMYVTDEVERVWKEAVVSYLKMITWNGWWTPRKVSIRTAGLQSEIQTQNVSNTKPQLC